MQLGFKYGGCKGFSKLYNYGLRHYPNYMITKEAEKRVKILLFWKKYGLQATTGLGMLIEQAALGFELWTGHKPPRDILFEAVGATRLD